MPEMSPLDVFRMEVMRTLAKNPELRSTVMTTNDEGRLPIVVALATERLATLLKRVDAVGGHATIFIKDDNHMHVAAFMNAAAAVDAESAENLVDVPENERPHPNASIGMFLTFLKGLPNGLRFAVRNDVPATVIRPSTEVQFA